MKNNHKNDLDFISEELLANIQTSDEAECYQYIEAMRQDTLTRLTLAFIREQLLPVHYRDRKIIFQLPKIRHSLCVNNVKLNELKRYIAHGDFYLANKNHHYQTYNNPIELLEIVGNELEKEINREQWLKFTLEVADHLRNAFLSHGYAYQRRKQIAKLMREHNQQYLCDWLQQQTDLSTTLFFESWVFHGHPYHPCSKTKLGFTAEEVVSYAPEFHPQIDISFAAIRIDYVHIESMLLTDNFAQWFKQNFFAVWQQWLRLAAEKQIAANEYLLMPLHPWQKEHIIKDYFAEFINAGIILLTDITLSCQPTLSFRTVAPIANDISFYIKLPVSVQATSMMRSLPTLATENNPRSSALLKDILIKENNFGNRLNILQELYGLHIANVDTEKNKHLSALFREKAENYLAADEIAIVVAALFELTPMTKLKLLIEIMQAAGVYTLNQAVSYFYRYANLVLSCYLDLYLLYGVALEGHQQNTIIVFSNNQPKRILARDLGGTEFDLLTLASQRFDLSLCPGSVTLWEGRRQIRRLLLHSVYQSHLGEIILTLTQHFASSEAVFWRVVKQITQQRFTALQSRMDSNTLQTEYQAIMQDFWPSKALLRMRLYDQCRDVFFTNINPLADIT